MNQEDRLRQLARLARSERPPRVDVADRVMARLQSRAPESAADMRPLAWVAGLSAAVAIPLAIAAFFAWQGWTDPLLGVFVEPPWGLL